MNYRNLAIIGTSHIAKQSLHEVEEAFEKLKPDIVALELDKKRLYSLMYSPKNKINFCDIRRVGVKGYLFSLFAAWVEKKLGEHVGVKPGSEMKVAVKLADRNKIKIELIDQDIEITLRRLSKALSWKEKWNFFVDIVKAVILRRKEIYFDLRKVPEKEIIKKLLIKTKQRYPNLYTVLVTERNEFMANRLARIMEKNNEAKILAIIGAGHEEDIIRLIKDPRIRYTISIG